VDLHSLIDSLNMPGLSAFMLGLVASLGPCTLTTNLAALAYISRKISERKFAVTAGALYTLGRMITYTVLGMLIIYAGLGIPISANFVQNFGEVAIGPILIIVGIAMLFMDRISFGEHEGRLARAAGQLADKGLIGALPLGVVLALAFCPYTAVLFFGVLIPLSLKTQGGVGLPSLFALGTGLPVILFGTLLSLGVAGVGRWVNAINRSEPYIRMAIAIFFIAIGSFYIGLSLKLY
jgi:cytochrome c-type biogenesis protein